MVMCPGERRPAAFEGGSAGWGPGP